MPNTCASDILSNILPTFIPDLRFIFLRDVFLFCIARFPSTKSRGYSNIIRHANWAITLDGNLTDDKRFQKATINEGTLPFFDELVLKGQELSREFGYAFQAFDLTVNKEGKIVCLESESLPQIEYYLTPLGVSWMFKILNENTIVPNYITKSRKRKMRNKNKRKHRITPQHFIKKRSQ